VLTGFVVYNLPSVFDPDRWQEIFETLRHNKLRAFLTSLSVAWGIFMLVVLLGAGNGLENGMQWSFRDDAVNSIWLWPGTTTLPYEGHPPGRRLRFKNEDHEQLHGNLDGLEHITSRFYPRDRITVTYGQKTAAFDIRSVHPDHVYLENTLLVAGRFLNDLDLAEKRKVAVIGTEVQKVLRPEGGDLLGSHIDIGGLPHRVIGVFHDEGGEEERRLIYVPITTAQVAWSGANRVDQIMFTVSAATTAKDSERMAEEARRILASRHKFDPADKNAIRVRNNIEHYRKIVGVIDGIGIFVWLIGLGTIVAGIVGVSNIMLISVKERTKEIGLRKAIGATPGSIVGMILAESIALTAIAGYVGLVGGIAVLELARKALPQSDFFRDPHVDLDLALAATLILVVAGALAGFFPARRAAAVSPVVALRDE
jgi:putative ABC transport system permease protein